MGFKTEHSLYFTVLESIDKVIIDMSKGMLPNYYISWSLQCFWHYDSLHVMVLSENWNTMVLMELYKSYGTYWTEERMLKWMA